MLTHANALASLGGNRRKARLGNWPDHNGEQSSSDGDDNKR